MGHYRKARGSTPCLCADALTFQRLNGMIEGFADQWRSKRVWAGCYRMTTCGTFLAGATPSKLPRFDRVVREAGTADQCRRTAMKSIERSYMYAVVKTGGNQYKVAVGEKIKVE